MDTTNIVPDTNGVEPSVVPNAQGTTPEVSTGTENQLSDQELAKLQQENAELDKYINSKGGADKVSDFISKIEEKRKLVAEHKQATKENSSFVWQDRIEKTDQAIQQANPEQFAQQTSQQTSAPAYPQSMADEINRNILRDVAGSNSFIKGEIENGDILKQAVNMGITIVENGIINRERLSQFAQMVNSQAQLKNGGMPTSNPQPTAPAPQYDRVPEGQMTMANAMEVVRITNSNPNSPHPDYARAKQVLMTGRVS